MGLNLQNLTQKDQPGYGTVTLSYQKASFMEGVLHSVVIYKLWAQYFINVDFQWAAPHWPYKTRHPVHWFIRDVFNAVP